MRVGWRETYLTKGLPSEESKQEIEGEIEKIRNKALTIAKDIVKNYTNQDTKRNKSDLNLYNNKHA